MLAGVWVSHTNYFSIGKWLQHRRAFVGGGSGRLSVKRVHSVEMEPSYRAEALQVSDGSPAEMWGTVLYRVGESGVTARCTRGQHLLLDPVIR